jgi:hypothetical protein
VTGDPAPPGAALASQTCVQDPADMSRFRVPLEDLDAVRVNPAEQQEGQAELRLPPVEDHTRPQPWLDGATGPGGDGD